MELGAVWDLLRHPPWTTSHDHRAVGRRAGAGAGGWTSARRLGLRVMDNEQARERLLAERAEVLGLLQDTEQAAEQDRETEDEQAETGDAADAAQPLAA